MGGSGGSTLSDSESTRLIRQLDSCDIGAFCKIHDRESVKAAELDEDTARRTVLVCLEGHGANWSVKFDFPRGLLGAEVDDRSSFVFYRPANRVLAVRRDVYVVHTTVHGNAFYAPE